MHEKTFSFNQAANRSQIIACEDILVEITDRPALETLLTEENLSTTLYKATATTLPEPCVEAHIQYKHSSEIELPTLEAGITFEVPDSSQVGPADAWQPELLSHLCTSFEVEGKEVLTLNHQRSTFYVPLDDLLSVRISLEEQEFSCVIAMKTVSTESIDDSYDSDSLGQSSRYETTQSFIGQWGMVLSGLKSFYQAHTRNISSANGSIYLQIFPPEPRPAVERNNPRLTTERSLLEHPLKSIRFNDIGGMREIKEQLRQTVSILLHPELAAHYDLQPMNGFFLTGPAKTGKTSLVYAFANEINAEVRAPSSTDIIGGSIGQSAKNLLAIFTDAKTSKDPLVLLFDEFDSIAPKEAISGVEREQVKNIFKQELAALKSHPHIFIAAISNRKVSDFDETLIGADRLTPLHMSLPDKNERREIWEITLAKSLIKTGPEPTPELAELSTENQNLHSKAIYDLELNTEELAEATPNMTGADIAAILHGARWAAFAHLLNTGERRNVTQKDILKHISRYQKP